MLKKVLLLNMMLFLTFTASCQNENIAHKAVKTYLFEKKIIIEKEIEWGKIDSLYSPFNTLLSYDYFMNKLRNDAEDISYELILASDNASKKILQDSLAVVHRKIAELNRSLTEIINAENKPNNRIGIKFRFLSQGREYDFIFVFDNNGQTIGHVLSTEQDVIDITKVIPKQF